MAIKFLHGQSFSRTILMAVGLIGILAGLLVARFGVSASINIAIVGFLLLPLLSKRKFPALLAILLIGLNLGLWRGQITRSQLDAYEPLYEQKVILVGEVIDDSSYAYKSQTEFHIGNVQLVTVEGGKELPGRVRVRG